MPARALRTLVFGGLIALGGCGEDRPAGTQAPAGAPPPIPQEIVDPASVPRVPKRVERIVLFALDGASWRLVSPLLEEGRLPTLARLLARGAHAELGTLEPTVSPAIWTTIATGMLPARHGILGFEGVPGATMETLPNSRMRRTKAWWNVLSGMGVSTGTIGWWASWPADSLAPGSFLVSDRVPYTRMEAAVGHAGLAPDDVFPPELLAELAALVERPNEISPEAVEKFLGMSRGEMDALLAMEYRMGSFLPEFKFVHQSDRSTWKIASHALARHPVDCAAVYFTGIDTVSHLFWHFTFPEEFPDHSISMEDRRRFGRVIPLYYEMVDDLMGRTLESIGGDPTVIVVSDHGFGGTGRLPWSGGHGSITPGAPIAPPGVLVMAGPGVAPAGRLAKAHVLDIAPTVLHLMGLPAAADMLGRVLVDALVPEIRAEPPRIPSWEPVGGPRVVAEIPLDPAGDAERLERLRALGYVQ
jgi:hypothetical protein